MKKKLFCLLMVICLFVGLFPMTVTAADDKPEAKFDFLLSGDEIPSGTEPALTMRAGDATQYYATKQSDPMNPLNWYLTPGSESEWNVKFEYPANGVPTITLKDATIMNKYGLWFGSASLLMSSDVNVVLEGTNKFCYLSGSEWFPPKNGLLTLNTTGTATIKGTGKLEFISDNDGETAAVIMAGGDLILDNTEIFINMPETYGLTNGIGTSGGDITVKGGNLTIVSYDDPNTHHGEGENNGFRRTREAMISATYIKKRADGTGGNFTVQDGANVRIIASSTPETDNDFSMMFTEGVFTIKDSTVELAMVGNVLAGRYLFSEKPTLEYKDDTYTVVAVKIAYPEFQMDPLTVTIREDRRVDYFNYNKVTLLTYFKVTPGGPGGPYCEFPQEEVTPSTPENETPDAPENETPNTPENETPNTPENETPNTPENETPNTPENETPNTPENETPNTPENETPNTPENETPNTPENETPNTPENETPDATEDNSTEGTSSATGDSEEQKTTESTKPNQATEPTQNQNGSASGGKNNKIGTVIVIIEVCILVLGAGGFALYWFVLKPKKK